MRRVLFGSLIACAGALTVSESALATAFAGIGATLETSMGNIVIELDPVHAPRSVANFIRYVNEKEFDNTLFYRVEPGFVIQGGSYGADGMYRPTHDPIPLEANNALRNVRGAVSMARTDNPNSADAEYFIVLQDTPALDHQPGDPGNTTGYAVFGHVVEGMDVVDRIAMVPRGGTGPFPAAAPTTPVVIRRVFLSTPPARP
jgi:cyclophilin family peptidyl-prolyl cis-trans isomerase